MAQQFANQAQSTLTSAYTAGDTSIYVTNGAVYPSTGNFTLAMGYPVQFYIVCTAISGNTLTVTTTGQEGTSTANLAIGSVVTQVVTAGVLSGFRTEIVGGLGTYASLPATVGYVGSRYKCTDSKLEFISNGSAWVPFVLGSQVTLPNNSLFSWVNQGSAAIVDVGKIFISTPNASGDNWRIRKKSLPSAPYTIEIGFSILSLPTQYAEAGLCLIDSGSGKLVGWCVQYVGSTTVLTVTNMNSPTSYSATNWSSSTGVITANLVFLKLYDDNTNRHYSWSLDGINWLEFFSHSSTTFITANAVGFFVSSEGIGFPIGMDVYHLRVY